MTPDAMHCAASTIRNMRSQLTAFEKFVNSPTFSKDEFLEIMKYVRRVCDAFERSLSVTHVGQSK